MAEQTQTAYSTSAFTDPTNILAFGAFLLGVLSDPAVLAIIPVAWMPKILALTGILTGAMRTFKATRPVSMIAPGEVKPVEIPKLQKTQQGSETK